VAASTAVPAGYNVSNSHCRFRGATATITSNRPLEAVFSFSTSFYFYFFIQAEE